MYNFYEEANLPFLIKYLTPFYPNSFWSPSRPWARGTDRRSTQALGSPDADASFPALGSRGIQMPGQCKAVGLRPVLREREKQKFAQRKRRKGIPSGWTSTREG